jgi:hypothetical protein
MRHRWSRSGQRRVCCEPGRWPGSLIGWLRSAERSWLVPQGPDSAGRRDRFPDVASDGRRFHSPGSCGVVGTGPCRSGGREVGQAVQPGQGQAGPGRSGRQVQPEPPSGAVQGRGIVKIRSCSFFGPHRPASCSVNASICIHTVRSAARTTTADPPTPAPATTTASLPAGTGVHRPTRGTLSHTNGQSSPDGRQRRRPTHRPGPVKDPGCTCCASRPGCASSFRSASFVIDRSTRAHPRRID